MPCSRTPITAFRAEGHSGPPKPLVAATTGIVKTFSNPWQRWRLTSGLEDERRPPEGIGQSRAR